MATRLGPETVRSICTAIAAAGFDTANRIKSIVQVAHENLGTSSIVIYEYNRTTEGLDLVAMSGVAEPELMRGPTDKLEFEWGRTTEPAELWIESDPDYGQHLDRLAQSGNGGKTKERGDFRKREADKHRQKCDPPGTLATAKVFLRKGVGQTDDPVGQAFFNFWKPHDQVTPVFTPEMRESICFIATIIRELLIDKAYHQHPSAIRWAPEGLLREINVAFDRDPALTQHDLERMLANIIRQAALRATENYSGGAQFYFMIGDRIARTFGGFAGEQPSVSVLPDKSVIRRCILERRSFVANIVRPGAYPEDFDRECRSAMVACVMHEGAARAVLQLTSRIEGYFLDSHAKAMQTLVHFARYGILRLDERLQRDQIVTALRFYTGGANLLRTGEAAHLMQSVLEAMDAEWGTYWPIERSEPGTLGRPLGGILFRRAEGIASVAPNHPEVGVRPWWEGNRGGLTQGLLSCTRHCPGTFFAVHALHNGKSGSDRPFDLLVYSANARCPLRHGGHCPAPTTKTCEICDMLRVVKLSPNTSRGQHTRLAFVVGGGKLPKGVVWLKFKDLRDVSWWERDYVGALSQSLGQFMGVQALHLAQRNFRHRLLKISGEAKSTVVNLIREARAGSTSDLESRLQKLKTYMLTVLWKTQEVRALLPSEDRPGARPNPDHFIGRLPLEDYVRMSRDVATSFKADPKQWTVVYEEKGLAKREASGVFYSALFNIATNIPEHGWEGVPGDERLAVVWIRQECGGFCTTVGNTGNPCTSDPFAVVPGSEEGHKYRKVGLHVAKALLERQGGQIRWLSREKFLRDNPSAPAELSRCVTFFEFTVAGS